MKTKRAKREKKKEKESLGGVLLLTPNTDNVQSQQLSKMTKVILG
jgi:hypothetical protein